MSQHSIFNRTIVLAGLAAVAASLVAPQGAVAQVRGGHGGGGHMGGGHGFGGGMHLTGAGHSSREPSIRNPGLSRYPRTPTHIADRHPGREPNHYRPPFFIPTYHRGPVFHPPIIVRGPVIVRERLPIVRIAVGAPDRVAPSVRPLHTYAPAPVACGTDGSFVSIVFVPTVTAADITAFLKAYNVTMADGPNPDGIYRIRLSTAMLPQNEVLQLIDSMRAQSAIVSSVDGA